MSIYCNIHLVTSKAHGSEFKGVLVGSAPSQEQAAKVVQMDATILALAHQGTLQFEQASTKAVGKLVNIAGRQRMLSQRMPSFTWPMPYRWIRKAA